MEKPWYIKYGATSNCDPTIELHRGDGELVADNESYYPQAISKENAEFIVKAVNFYLEHNKNELR